MEDMLGFTPSKQMFNDSLSLLIDSQKWLDTFISGRTSKFGLIILIFLWCLLYQVVRWILFIFENNTISTIILKIGFKIPIVNWKINKKLRREYEFLYSEMSKIFHSNSKHLNEVVPEHPLKVEVVKEEFSAISNKQVKQYSTGMHSGTVYHSEEKVLNNWIISSMENFWFSNAFDYSQHNSMVQMEYDILNIVKNLFNGDDDTYVLTTTGGTESIIAAIAAYKFWARAEKGITKPNLVFYASAHAAFIKGWSYMDIEQRIIPLDKNGVAIPNKIHQYVDSNTIAIVCTAWNYAHGTIDDVAQIASIAADYNVGWHVDNWLGGFVNWFIEYLNKSVLPFDFRTRGVTSISADTHKYGYGPKGMSTLMFRPKKLLDYLMFISVDHSGAPFVMRNLGTNRSGAVVAGTWSALMQNSLKGYILKVKRIQDSTKKIRDAIREIPELVLYSPNNSYTVKAFVVPLMKCAKFWSLMFLRWFLLSNS